MNKKYTYTFKKATKTTYVFENEELGVYYLPKDIFDGEAPAAIQVTLEL